MDEARQQNLRQGVPPWMALPLVLTALEVDLQPALDLTDGRVRRALRVSRDRMLGGALVAPPGPRPRSPHPGARPARPLPRLRGPAGTVRGPASGGQRRDLPRPDRLRGSDGRRESGPPADGAAPRGIGKFAGKLALQVGLTGIG